MLSAAVGIRQSKYFAVILYVACLVVVSAEISPAQHNGEHESDIEPFVAVQSEKSRQRRGDDEGSIPPWLGNLHGAQIKYTRYSKDENDAKRHRINSPPNVKASKRTIKIGNQVCGTIKSDPKHGEKWDDKRNADEAKSNDDDEKVISQVHNCCFDHSKCPRSVPAKTTKFGFTNDIEYTIMSCKCDSAFRRCLKDMKSYTADAIGHLYFDALKIPCLTFYDETNDSPRRNIDMISVVPDVAITHPKIGGAQVILKPNEGGNDKKDFFYTHEQEGVADSKEKGRQSSHPQLVRRVQYPTPKFISVTNKVILRSENENRRLRV